MRSANINLTPYKMMNIFRAGASLSETPNIPVRPTKNIRFNEHPASRVCVCVCVCVCVE